MSPAELVELVRWIEQQHRAAVREADRLMKLAEALEVTAGENAAGLRRKFIVSADLGAATGRLETWNEIRGELTKALHV